MHHELCILTRCHHHHALTLPINRTPLLGDLCAEGVVKNAQLLMLLLSSLSGWTPPWAFPVMVSMLTAAARLPPRR